MTHANSVKKDSKVQARTEHFVTSLVTEMVDVKMLVTEVALVVVMMAQVTMVTTVMVTMVTTVMVTMVTTVMVTTVMMTTVMVTMVMVTTVVVMMTNIQKSLNVYYGRSVLTDMNAPKNQVSLSNL